MSSFTSSAKTLLVFWAFVIAVSMVIVLALRYGRLSPRGEAILLLTVMLTAAATLIGWAWQAQPPLSRPITDSAERKRRLREIRFWKIAILVLVPLLLNGLRIMLAGDNHIWPLATGAAVNVLIIATSVIVVRRLQKSHR